MAKASVYEVYVLPQDDTASPSLDSFNLLSLMDVYTAMPHRAGILNNRAHIPNVPNKR